MYVTGLCLVSMGQPLNMPTTILVLVALFYWGFLLLGWLVACWLGLAWWVLATKKETHGPTDRPDGKEKALPCSRCGGLNESRVNDPI